MKGYLGIDIIFEVSGEDDVDVVLLKLHDDCVEQVVEYCFYVAIG